MGKLFETLGQQVDSFVHKLVLFISPYSVTELNYDCLWYRRHITDDLHQGDCVSLGLYVALSVCE